MLNICSCSPSETQQAILDLWQNEKTKTHVPLLHGAPGIGKSAIVKAVASALGATLIDLRLMQLDPTDLRGQTMIDPASMLTRHLRPEFLPEFTTDPDAPKFVLFLDEILAAHDSLRKGAFELLLDRRVGPHKLGPNVYLIGAGNTEEDGSLIHLLDPPTADRFFHVRVIATVESFLEHAITNRFHPDLISFLQSNISVFEPQRQDITAGCVALPSPRSFERWSEILYARLPKRTQEIALKGWCGDSVGALFIAAMAERDEQYNLMELVKAAPEKRRYPTTAFAQFSLANNLLVWADDKEKLKRAIDIMVSMPDDLGTSAECKQHFINSISTKLNTADLYELIRDPRIIRFLNDRMDILNGEKLTFDQGPDDLVSKAA